MNKAFVKENDDSEELEEEVAASPLPVGSKNYITPLGYARLMEEYQWLLNKERPEVTAIVSWAAGNGDRSENGDYIYGKRRLREIDKPLRLHGEFRHHQRNPQHDPVPPFEIHANTSSLHSEPDRMKRA